MTHYIVNRRSRAELQGVEPGGELVHVARRGAAARQRDPRLAAPQGVAERGADMPGHDVVKAYGLPGEPGVSVGGSSEQARSRAKCWDVPEVVLGLGGTGGLPVDDQAELVAMRPPPEEAATAAAPAKES